MAPLEFLSVIAGFVFVVAVSICVGVGLRIGFHLVDIVFSKFFE